MIVISLYKFFYVIESTFEYRVLSAGGYSSVCDLMLTF